MNTSLIISAALAVLFVGATIMRTKKIPESISAMVYSLPKSSRWIWIVWMWAVSLTLAPSLIEKCGLVGFLTIGCLIFCGAMPLVKDEPNKMHNVFGIAAGILSQVCVAIINPWWLLLWIVLLPFIFGAMASFDDTEEPVVADGKGVMISECIAFTALITSNIII